jgi:glycine hydroxymethyltransferase
MYVVFVCTGNVCRSPMAEALFRDLTKTQAGFISSSAGIGAADNQPPSAHSITAMRELGIDISDLRSRMISPAMVADADLILAMTFGHHDVLQMLFPEAADKIFLLREFEEAADGELEIDDPIGQPVEVYRACRDQIHTAVKALTSALLDGGRPADDETFRDDTNRERRRQTIEKLKLKINMNTPNPNLQNADPEIFHAISAEKERQFQNIELIASENFTSRAVMEAQGSCLTNKYAEGYPGKRWYGGCENVDVVEQLAIDRAKRLFGAEHVNIQPHSGSQANTAVYFSVLQVGDRILTMDLSHGGHLTHGHKMNFSGKLFEVRHYGVSPKTEAIDYDELQKAAAEFKPKMITVGASAYARIIDFKRMGEIARSVGAYLFADIAHIAGLVAAGVHPSPVEHADFVTTTTHKTLRGPRGGLVMCREKFAKEIDATVFPGFQGGPLMHVIAAKAVCLGEALKPEFRDYQRQVVRNAKALCEGMKKNGYRIVSGTTENHVMLVDVQPQGLTGKEVQEALDKAGITVNKNAIPFDRQSPFKAGGFRLGSPAVTTRGMKENEMFDIANFIHEGIQNRADAASLSALRKKVRAFTANYPLPG